MRTRLLVLVVISLFSSDLPVVAQTEIADIRSWAARVRTSLRLDRDRYDVGDVITLTASMTNKTPRPFSIFVSGDETGRADGYRFEVRRDGGPPVADPWPGFAGSVLGTTAMLEPDVPYSREFTLNEHMPVLKPGRYTVKMMSPAESESVHFAIEARPPEVLRDRVDALLAELGSGEAARPVVPLLAYTGHSAAIPALVERLYVQDDAIEARVAHWLVLFDHDEVVRALRQALKDRGPRSRMIYLLVVTLHARPEDVVPLLLPWLSSTHDGTRLAAVEGLSYLNQTKDPKLFGPLAAMLHDATPEIIAQAAMAVAAYQNEAAFKALAPLLADPDRPHAQAVTAMCWIAQAPDPRGVFLKDALKLLTDVAHGRSLVASKAGECVGEDARRARP